MKLPELPSIIIRHAQDMSIDVVIVDSAGRMQGNEPVRSSIAKVSQK